MKSTVTILVFCVAALLALGLVILYSSGMARVGARHFLMQLVWGGIGIVFCILIASSDYRILRKHAWLIYGAALLMLVLVLESHIGTRINGARRWFSIGGLRFQPSEFAKFALIVAIAWYGERYQRRMTEWWRGIIIPIGIIAPVLGLIFVEPDRGTTILLAGVAGTLLLVCGVRWSSIVPPFVLGVAGLAFSIWHDPMRTKRIFSWLYLEENKEGVGYQAWQAMLSLGAGGWTGVGLGNGRHKLGFIPEHHTDFIFSVIGEELGLVASLLVIAAFVAVVICGLVIAVNAPDRFGTLLGSGIAFLIGMQAFINIGVVTSALPNKGLPLPFISYGGSNLLMMLMAVGVLLSIARQTRAPEKQGLGQRSPAQTATARIS